MSVTPIPPTPDPDDGPHVSRVIRTSGAIVSIRGTLTQVDAVYKIATHALLDSGKYTIPKPSTDHWANFGAPPEVSTDHLQRRIQHLQALLDESENYEALRAMRQTFKQVEAERDQFKTAFWDICEMVSLALSALNDPTLPDSLARIVARGQLE